ncbi:MAG: hypothetical protein RLZZ618_3397 [Pseudomonadota bacterium]|jgi:protein involved in polysaccharide export with SLBB domain
MNLTRLMRTAVLTGSIFFSLIGNLAAQGSGMASEQRQPRDRGAEPMVERAEERDTERRNDESATGVVRVREVPAKEPTPVLRSTTRDGINEELEFQSFVNRNYGKWLPIFGRDAFNALDQGFDIPVTSTPSDNYEIGPGDEIRIKISGSIDMDANVVVDNTGFITLPRVGAIMVSGVVRRDLESVISKAVSRIYKNFTLHVYTGALRTISVFVVGHAGRPGAYRVPATSSLLNALYAAGGVSATGSLRGVKLMRSGKEVGLFDFYDFISKGSTEGDQPLRNGDVIHIPAAGARVALLGAANVQAIFEISPKATSLAALLEVAGGLPSASRNESITIDRLDRDRPEAPRQVIALDTKALAAGVILQDGDVVTLHRLGNRYADMVSVRGNVYQPLRQPFRPGMRVTDLIPHAGVLYSQETVRAQNDLTLGIAARARDRSPERRTASPEEAGARQVEAMVPSDNINWNLASIERREIRNGQTSLVQFNLGKALSAPGGADDIELLPGDQIVVYGDRNLTLPQQLRNRFARVEGEVLGAGLYQLRDGETLRQLIERAGGLTSRGFLYGIKVRRQSEVVAQKEQMNKAVSLLDDAIANQMTSLLASAPTAEEKSVHDAMIAEMRRRADAMKRLQPDGRITLDMPYDASLGDLPNMELEDGDIIVLPVKPQQVTVAGSVQNPLTTVWSKGQTLDDYVSSAVLKRSADASEIYVVRANGRAEVVRRGGMFSSRSTLTPQPGDVIYVPEKQLGLSGTAVFMRGLRDWSTVLFQLLIGASVAKSL